MSLHIPVTADRSTDLVSLTSLFINQWSGGRTREVFVLDTPLAPPLFRLSTVAEKATNKQVRISTSKAAMTTLPCLELPAEDDLAPLKVSGLAAVCRHIIKNCQRQEFQAALGFRSNCLQAPAEVSLWTSFCEVRMPAAVQHFINSAAQLAEMSIPTPLLQLEQHLKKPIRTHNVMKLCRDAAHTFAEGPNLTLSDLVLYPSVRIAADIMACRQIALAQHLPNVHRWLAEMDDHVCGAWSQLGVRHCEMLDETLRLAGPATIIERRDPLDERHSLDRRDVQRTSSTARLDIDAVVGRLTCQQLYHAAGALQLEDDLTIDLDPDDDYQPFVDWRHLPHAAHPQQGQVPDSRLERKMEQLDNVIAAVGGCVSAGWSVVDFCSGSGHLGVVLAHLLPQCHLVLVDNKEESVRQARLRVAQLRLDNITLIQSNLDYFTGKFEAGVALHACGVATDLVLDACLKNRAAFVLCPCCYGNLALRHLPVEYPQSALFRERGVDGGQFALVARVADHETPEGRSCMAAVDLDRGARAVELGYRVQLKTLRPKTCSPKHNLLIGYPDRQEE